MKVIGRTSGPSGEYIAIVRHEELEKLTSKYHGKLPKLEIGGEMDLGIYPIGAALTQVVREHAKGDE
jgi:hypothetical protein